MVCCQFENGSGESLYSRNVLGHGVFSADRDLKQIRLITLTTLAIAFGFFTLAAPRIFAFSITDGNYFDACLAFWYYAKYHGRTLESTPLPKAKTYCSTPRNLPGVTMNMLDRQGANSPSHSVSDRILIAKLQFILRCIPTVVHYGPIETSHMR